MILIAGQAGVGKSTLANFIAEEAFKKGLTPVLLSFASPLKEEAARKGYGKEVNPKKYRKYCQEIGAARRAEDPDYWVRRFDDKVKKIQAEEQLAVQSSGKFWERVIIIDDARYPNELAYGQLYDAASIFISAKGRDDLDLDAPFRQHESELLAQRIDNGVASSLLRGFDNIIFNDEEGIEGLKASAVEMVPEWCGLTADNYCDSKDTCTCKSCTGKPSLEDIDLDALLDDLKDLLNFPDPEEDEEDQDEYT